MAKPNVATIAVKHDVTFAESLVITTSNGLPPPDELSGVGSGELGAVVVLNALDALDDALVGEEDCRNVGTAVVELGVGEELESEVDVSGSSVSVASAELVDVGRTVVNVSAGLLEVGGTVKVVGSAVELLLGLDTGVSGEDVPGQTSATRLPSKTCPSTVAASALTS
jgi:hypothetical protein